MILLFLHLYQGNAAELMREGVFEAHPHLLRGSVLAGTFMRRWQLAG